MPKKLRHKDRLKEIESAFQGTQHNALDKIFLEKRISKDNGERGKNNHGIFHLYGRNHLLDGVLQIVGVQLGKINGLGDQNSFQI